MTGQLPGTAAVVLPWEGGARVSVPDVPVVPSADGRPTRDPEHLASAPRAPTNQPEPALAGPVPTGGQP